MKRLQADHLLVQVGARTLFHIERLDIWDGERIGLVGENGAGKSTLLSVLYGDRLPDAGTVTRMCACAMVRQFGEAEEGFDPAIAARLHEVDAHVGMSGGEETRRKLSHALAMQAPLLLLDEPTTHLDFEGLRAVQETLQAYAGAMVLVSHDRELLDALCTRIWALEDGGLQVYTGNWSDYRRERERAQAFAQFEYAQYRAEQARLRGVLQNVREGRAAIQHTPKRMGNSEARLHKNATASQQKLENRIRAIATRLEKLPEKERPRVDTGIQILLGDLGGITSSIAAKAEHLTCYGGAKRLLHNAHFVLQTGCRMALVGPNGCGKSTLLAALRDGKNGVRLSPGVKTGWFAQQALEVLRPEQTLLENVMRDSVHPEQDARAILAHLKLREADMNKPAAVLSGGERAKCVLAILLTGNFNLLLLDEPGNYLDLYALEALEEVLAGYTGTLVLVSHDVRMIDRIAQKLCYFEGETLHSFDGNYTAWKAESERNSMQEAEKLSESILRMRIAALVSRIPSAKTEADRAAFEAEYAKLSDHLIKIQNLGKRKP